LSEIDQLRFSESQEEYDEDWLSNSSTKLFS
jgi:hypothetical protein